MTSTSFKNQLKRSFLGFIRKKRTFTIRPVCLYSYIYLLGLEPVLSQLLCFNFLSIKCNRFYYKCVMFVIITLLIFLLNRIWSSLLNMFFCVSVTADSNKIRHLRRRKLWTEKKKLFEKIWLYNQQVPEEERIVEEKVEGKLSLLGGNDEEDSLIWPWEMHSSGMKTFMF